MKLKERFEEIDQMTSLMIDLIDKQTDGFSDELCLIYKLTLIAKIQVSNDDSLEDSMEIFALIDHLKGQLLLEEDSK